jgi:hypothetical protein
MLLSKDIKAQAQRDFPTSLQERLPPLSTPVPVPHCILPLVAIHMCILPTRLSEVFLNGQTSISFSFMPPEPDVPPGMK